MLRCKRRGGEQLVQRSRSRVESARAGGHGVVGNYACERREAPWGLKRCERASQLRAHIGRSIGPTAQRAVGAQELLRTRNDRGEDLCRNRKQWGTHTRGIVCSLGTS